MALRDPRFAATWKQRTEQFDMPRKSVWQGYLLSEQDRQQLDAMMGRALLDARFCERLLHQRTESLLAEFGFSDATEEWLCSIEAGSLTELAQAVTAA